MKTIIVFLLMVGSIPFLQAQIGIHTENPQSTFEIKAKNPTGNSSIVDGILIPKVDRQRAQNMQNVVTSTLVYINDISTGSLTGTTINVSQPGFYSFDGSVWVKWKLKEGTPILPITIINNSAAGGTPINSGQAYRLLVNQQNVIINNGLSITTGRDSVQNRDYFVFPETGIYEVQVQGNFLASVINAASLNIEVYSSPAPYTSFTMIDVGRSAILLETNIGTNTSYTFYINITEPKQRIAFAYRMGGDGNWFGQAQLVGGKATSFIFKKL